MGPSKPFTPDLAQDNYAATDPEDRIPDTDPNRDLAFESRFLADAHELAGRLTGISNFAYPLRVNHRLDIGRERYGDGDFLGKDCIQEVLEETPDLAAYAMLELQRLGRLDSPPVPLSEIRLDLVAVAAYGSIADYYAQRAGRRIAGLEP